MSRKKATAAAAALAAAPPPAPPAADPAAVKPEAEADKPEAQIAAEDAPQDAAQAAQLESTLGDGDATGVAQEAPSATAAPEASAPNVVTAEGGVVRVLGPAKGRWRIGRKFGPEVVEIAASDLTADELERLTGDPELKVLIIQDAV